MRKKVAAMLVVMLCTSMLLTAQLIQQGLSESLLGCWNFEEGEGTTAYDSSGNNRHSIEISGATWVNYTQKVLERPADFNWNPPPEATWSKYGLYMLAGKVRVPILYETPPSAITIDAFIAAENPGGEHQVIIFHGYHGQFELSVYGGALYFGVTLAGSGVPGDWFVVQVGLSSMGFGIAAGRVTAIWKKGGFMRLLFYPYIKFPNRSGYFCRPVSSYMNVPDLPLSDPGPNFYASIGCYSQLVGDSKWFQGTIDRVRVYDEVVYPSPKELYPPMSEEGYQRLREDVYPPDPPVPGLLAWWRFTEGGGPIERWESWGKAAQRHLSDWSGNNYHGVIEGNRYWYSKLAYRSPVRTEYALFFDGSYDYVHIPTLFAPNSVTGITVSAWIRPLSLGGWQHIVRHGDNGEFELTINQEPVARSLGFSAVVVDPLTGVGTWYSAKTQLNATIYSNRWTYVTGQWTKGGSLKLFIDGNPVSETSVPDGFLSDAEEGHGAAIGTRLVWTEDIFGNWYWDSSKSFLGFIDGVKIYSTAITKQRIMEDMQTLGGSSTYPPELESTDSVGNKKDTFVPGESVYVTGYYYNASSNYDIYVVNNTALHEGMPIPERVTGTATTVTTEEAGIIAYSDLETTGIPPALLWSNAKKGNYDIIIDVNKDEKFNSSIDTIDNYTVKGSGFYVGVPEPPMETLTLIALSIVLLYAACLKKKKYRPTS